MRLYVGTKITICSLLMILLAAQSNVAAQSKSELRESMKQRYPRLEKLRDEGKIGETYRGYVEAVTDDAAKDRETQDLVKAENADRRALYAIIAQDVGTTPEAVGRINAQRVLEDGDEDMFFKTKAGVWVKKKNLDTAG